MVTSGKKAQVGEKLDRELCLENSLGELFHQELLVPVVVHRRPHHPHWLDGKLGLACPLTGTGGP